ncbi:DUF58 domain-containing protein [Kangiella sp. HZ709]|uniref:DUF58 domain-containing protein n=1 Tax=Kangiella sp. HZ709 TaxID=2666328 RepID=UPI0012B064A4|nr:DUF58 domain-containing protein [Kangiella sp. HZ709]MRX28509.1 DUF58 domain-containing protein [Kangiella sp. HZ709]
MQKSFSANNLSLQAETIELSLEQLIACQYMANDKVPLPNKKTKAHLVGGHLSPFKGRGMEFSEVRQYQAGDDIRTIDWRVTARTGKVHTKIFQEERERPVFIVLDLQDSMFFGSKNRFKSTLASIQAARAFWVAFNSGNRVGALLNNAHTHHELKPSNRRKDGLRMLQKILEVHNHRLSELYNPQSQAESYKINRNSLSDSLLRLRHLTKGGCLIYVFSDFMDFTDECDKHLAHLSQHNDIYGVMLSDPLEQTIDVAGHYHVTDGHNTLGFNANSRKNVRNYQQHFAQRFANIKNRFIQNQCYFNHLSTQHSINHLALNPMALERQVAMFNHTDALQPSTLMNN